LIGYDISTFHNSKLDHGLSSGRYTETTVDDCLVDNLSHIFRTICSTYPRATTQLYCFSSEEVSALNQIVVHKSLSADDSDSIRICIGAIVDLPLALLTTIQPELLDNALYRSWTKAKRPQLEGHLADLGLDTSGTVKTLQERLGQAMSTGKPSPRRTPRVVSVHQSVSELVALPGPGFVSLEDCTRYLVGSCSVPTEDEMFELARDKKFDELTIRLRAKGMIISHIIESLRHRIREHYPNDASFQSILVNDAQPLKPAFLQLCQNDNLRKLLFMHEVFPL
jgi:hypothetical protein